MQICPDCRSHRNDGSDKCFQCGQPLQPSSPGGHNDDSEQKEVQDRILHPNGWPLACAIALALILLWHYAPRDHPAAGTVRVNPKGLAEMVYVPPGPFQWALLPKRSMPPSRTPIINTQIPRRVI